ncbi:MAG: hypothetical protein IKZ07_09065, partial [Akkermansia sp.]|nr:hypothetical protein [Akkermansia sp.]
MPSSTQNSSFTPNDTALPVGYKLHDYIIEDVLGQGGFGITYSAREILTNYPVVIKESFLSDFAYRDRITGELNSTPEGESFIRWAQEHFERTATLLHKLPRHNNIVHVTNVFRKLNTTYCVMEKIEGR